MRIGIDARMFGPRQGGIGRYIQQIITELEKIDTHNQYVIFLRRENWEEYNPTNPNFKKILANIPWYGWKEQILFPRVIKRERVDLMHFPHWNIPLIYNQPFVVTIHDLLLLHYPTRAASTLGPIGYFFKNLAYRLVLWHATKMAKQILTVSEYSKQDIVKQLNISPKKITVTHLAPLETNNQPTGDQKILAKYKITKPYILYVGVAFPHKNLTRLVDAWKIFNAQYGSDYQLVLVGKHNFFYRQLVNYSTAQSINNITFTGFIPDNELSEMYKNAKLYIFPSLYEGFGLPPLEAMQYKIPVVSSNRTCMPEVLRDAAEYFNPEDHLSMSDAIWRGISDETLRTKLVQAGQKLIHSYSWEKAGKTTWETYQKMV